MTEMPPNKCDFCGLRVFYRHHSVDSTTSSDEAFAQLRKMKELRIIKRVPSRSMDASNDPRDFGSTAFCAVTSKAWKDRGRPCNHWALKIEGASVADYLSIYHEKRSRVVGIWLAIAAIVVSVVVAATQVAIQFN